MTNPTLHIYNRLAFGPLGSDLDAEVPDLEEFLESQLYPAEIPDTAVERRVDAHEMLGLSGAEILERYPERRDQRQAVQELIEAKIDRALSSQRQLNEVMVDFWFNHFNVFAGKNVCSALLPSYEREAIRPHALGRFRDLVHATARHPAMLFYLDNWLSVSPNVRGVGRRRGLNENYARELMELHTLGVDAGYSQEDVVEVARAFTGWTMEGPRRPVFRFVPRFHDSGSKQILGQRFRGADMREGEQVIDFLVEHPSTSRFVSAKLARKFISDDPPQSIVDRAASRFRETGGDVREVLRTIVLSEEFALAEGQKVKTPFEFVVSAFRRVEVQPRNLQLLVRSLTQMGQRPYGAVPPTGYPDAAQDWMSSGALMARLNLVTQMAVPARRAVTVDTGMASEQIIRTLGTAGFQRK